jgi:hypothetical protein
LGPVYPRWGRFNPAELNDDPDFAEDQRGLNSLQIMTFLLSAAHHSNSTESAKFFTDAAETLIADGYAVNILSQTITAPTEINFSDNDLSFKPMYTLAAACGWGAFNSSRAGELGRLCHQLHPFFRHSVDRSMKIIVNQKVALYDIIYGVALGEDGRTARDVWLGDAVVTLQEYPVELIRWPSDNTQRLDLPVDPAFFPALNRSITSIPRYQSAALKPMNDPFAFVGGSGFVEEDPTFWHMTYWMMRYHKLS